MTFQRVDMLLIGLYCLIAISMLRGSRVLTHPAIWALLRLRLIIQTSLLGRYMRQSA